MKITYSKQYKNEVLDSFGYASKDGKVVSKKNGKPVLDNLGNEISTKKFSGFRKGSLDIIGNDASSLIKLRKNLKDK